MSDLTQRRAADDLFRIFEAKILHGELRDGQALPPERDIVQSYSVSRTVVREAIKALANKGLVDAKPRFRPVVLAPSYDAAFDALGSLAARVLTTNDGVKNLFDLRIMLEASLVRMAATQANKVHIQKMREALDANAAAIDDSERFYDTDVAFHAVLFDVPGNPMLPSIHRAYTDWLREHWVKMPRLPDRNRTNYAAHSKILDCILLRDPDAAEAALRAHLSDAWEQVRRTFPQTSDGDKSD